MGVFCLVWGMLFSVLRCIAKLGVESGAVRTYARR